MHKIMVNNISKFKIKTGSSCVVCLFQDLVFWSTENSYFQSVGFLTHMATMLLSRQVSWVSNGGQREWAMQVSRYRFLKKLATEFLLTFALD